MGDGNTSSYRWQTDRQTTTQQKLTLLLVKYQALREAYEDEVEENIKLSLEVAKLNRIIGYKRGDELV